MSQQHTLTPTCSRAWSTAQLKITVNYSGDPEQFQKDIMSEVVRLGYTAILHYNGYYEVAFKVRKNKVLFEKILTRLERVNRGEEQLRVLKTVRSLDGQALSEYLEDCKGKGIDLYHRSGMKCTGLAR